MIAKSGLQWTEWDDRYASVGLTGGPVRVNGDHDHDPEYVAPPFLGFHTPAAPPAEPAPPAPQMPVWTPEDGDNA